MYKKFGAIVDHNKKTVQFRLFIPNENGNQHEASLPEIESVRVVGDFHKSYPEQWEKQTAEAKPFDKIRFYHNEEPVGWAYESKVIPLEDGFYQYKFVVRFDGGEVRWINDPCTHYYNHDGKYDNSCFVVGGTIAGADFMPGRKPLKDLIIYELMIDDFTKELMKDSESPIDVLLRDSTISYLKSLGINAVEFMPWTAWTGGGFSWGYMPYLFFSVTDRYLRNVKCPLEKLSKLKKLIAKLHENGIQVIMDGVFNHVAWEFPYYQLYRTRDASPYTGRFQGADFGEDLDFHNTCTHQFILDVCKYWIDEFGIDGIRFDYTRGFYDYSGNDIGLKKIIRELKDYFRSDPEKYKNIALILEHIGEDARHVAVDVGASGYWFDNFLWKMNEYIHSGYGHINNGIMKILCSSINWKYDTAGEILPVNYIETHDSSNIVNRISNPGSNREVMWKTQPYMLALFTMPGAIMIHNGQEYGEDYWLPEMHEERPPHITRVRPRPLRWDYLNKDKQGRHLFNLYSKLIAMRKAHPSLSSINFHPADERWQCDHFIDGYGFDKKKQVVIYHRWGNGADGRLERFIAVLNFSGQDQYVDIPFSVNGEWEDILNDEVRIVENYSLQNEKINSNWGRIFCRRD